MDKMRKQIKKRKINRGKIQAAIQLSYIFIFLFSAIGICGNIELDVETPIYCWTIFAISGFLSIGKIIYMELEGRKENVRKTN